MLQSIKYKLIQIPILYYINNLLIGTIGFGFNGMEWRWWWWARNIPDFRGNSGSFYVESEVGNRTYVSLNQRERITLVLNTISKMHWRKLHTTTVGSNNKGHLAAVHHLITGIWGRFCFLKKGQLHFVESYFLFSGSKLKYRIENRESYGWKVSNF